MSTWAFITVVILLRFGDDISRIIRALIARRQK